MPRYPMLNRYNTELTRKKGLSLTCPVCNLAPLSSMKFEAHFRDRHGLDPRRCCVWCLGEERWEEHGQKHLHADHILKCFRAFVQVSSQPPVEEKNFVGLVVYSKTIRKDRRNFTCPECLKNLTSGVFEKHCREEHALDPKSCCVWCFGRERWARGRKNRNADHLMLCFRNFMVRRATLLVVSPSEETSRERRIFDDFTETRPPLCEPRQFFDCEDVSADLNPLAFETFDVLDHGNRVDFFRDENVNRAASYVRMFEETKQTFDWIHAMVKAVTFENFLDAVRRVGGVRFLPFSCWCDGGSCRRAKFRQHRHFILVSEGKGRFKRSVWPLVRPSVKPAKGNFQSKNMKVIDSTLYLVNTLGYVCKRESKCNLIVGSKKGPKQDKHFYVFEPLPVDYLLPLSVQWKGGVMEVLYQEKFTNVSVSRLIEEPSTLVFRNGKWRQKVEDFYGIEGGSVLPLKKGFAPDERGNRFVYLVGDRRLTFSFSEENLLLDDEAWLGRQVRGGNGFYEAVGSQLWTPRERDQGKLNLVMPYVRRNGELESQNQSLTSEVGRQRERVGELERTNSIRDEEMRDLKARVGALEEEITDLKRNRENEMLDLKRSHEKEMLDLKRCHEKEMLDLKRSHEKEMLDLKRSRERLESRLALSWLRDEGKISTQNNFNNTHNVHLNNYNGGTRSKSV